MPAEKIRHPRRTPVQIVSAPPAPIRMKASQHQFAISTAAECALPDSDWSTDREISVGISLEINSGCAAEIEVYTHDSWVGRDGNERAYSENTQKLSINPDSLPLLAAALNEAVRRSRELRLWEIAEAEPERWTA